MTDMDVKAAADIKEIARQNTSTTPTLHECVEHAMKNYFMHLEGQSVTGIYDMVLSEVEAALFESVLNYTRGNQTTAAALLGVNRGTLRKKLKQYRLI
jgi:Fis family transcriptional regulator